MKIKMLIRGLTALIMAVTTVGLYFLVIPPDKVRAAPNEINGTVFLDYNDDGQMGTGDVGIGGVTVTAYDLNGIQITSTTTAADGTYTLAVPDGSEVRVEFTDIPGDLRPGAVGANTQTTVVFVTSPVDNADMGVYRPDDYCQDDPYLASPCYFHGDPLLQGSDAGSSEVLRSFPYSASGTNPGLQTPLALGSEIGPTWGLAYQRNNRTLFAGALMKRHVGFGPLGTGGIYSVQIDPATGQPVGAPTPFLNLNAIGIPTGADPHSGLPAVATTPSTDPLSWDAVGKVAIGDMGMSADDERLWLTNLFNQTLYSINLASRAVMTSDSIVAAMGNVGGLAANCAASDVRPWAIDVHGGYIYVGVVCSAQSFSVPAQSVQAVDALRAYILRRPDDTSAASFELVFDFDLDYPRSYASTSNDISARWRPWIGTMTTLCRFVNATTCNLAYDKQIIYPQPILSDIEFDDDGSIIVALMDRAGHQAGTANFATSNPWGTPTLYRDLDYPAFVTFTADFTATRTFEGVAPGDILRICTVGGVYALENNSNCGGTTTGGQGNNQGPGGGEFYFQDNFGSTHTETVVGGLVLLPGNGEVGTSIFDPFTILSGGAAWFDNLNGENNRRYEILPQDDTAARFGKAAGLGDIEAFCYQPPIEIGNRVWLDQDTDGVQDPGEQPLAGVTLELYQGSTLIATAVTDSNGNYIFSSGPGNSTTSLQYNLNLLPNTQYEIRIPNAEGTSQQPALASLFLTSANTNTGTNSDSRDSDGLLVGVFAINNLVTGALGDNNHTYDFGFSNTAPTIPPVTPPGGGDGGGGGGDGGVDRLAGFIPVTSGFAPGQITDLSGKPVTRYHTLADVTLEIPVLKLELPVVGIPMKDKTWDVNWLLNQAGWLEGSAFPGFSGNSVLTSHVTLPYGQAGPFANLYKLKAGDKVFVHAYGSLDVYEIKSVEKLDPKDASIFRHENKPWLTLLTCADYDEKTGGYLKHLVVKAVLVHSQPEWQWTNKP
jgi:LPXTG-site transpeptidase (sortase) family protein